MTHFDRIAPYYDFLANLIFGNVLHRASTSLLKGLPEHVNVLVLGGGTGRLLASLPMASRVTYLDLSSKMLFKAKKRNKSHVTFIQMDFLQWESTEKFDVIICPFFLDVFPEEDLSKALEKIKVLLDTGGQLIATDFRNNGRAFSRILLSVMHAFFRWTVAMKSRKLLDINFRIMEKGFKRQQIKLFRKGLIFSAEYALDENKKAQK
ncbi:MAG: class I SAM-dependent methyltransferase [Cyclobacteriaceae bacterium]|nr:class I SAM-dependent methyltransferase [Cyclobacteriaceae bacterium HetDA_MAG_MS6]